MTDKQIKVLGWLASSLAILMYVSYIPQIIGNLMVIKHHLYNL